MRYGKNGIVHDLTPRVICFMLHDRAKSDYMEVYDFYDKIRFHIVVLQDTSHQTIMGKKVFFGKWPSDDKHFGLYVGKESKVEWDDIKHYDYYDTVTQCMDSMPRSWILSPPRGLTNTQSVSVENKKWWQF